MKISIKYKIWIWIEIRQYLDFDIFLRCQNRWQNRFESPHNLSLMILHYICSPNITLIFHLTFQFFKRGNFFLRTLRGKIISSNYFLLQGPVASGVVGWECLEVSIVSMGPFLGTGEDTLLFKNLNSGHVHVAIADMSAWQIIPVKVTLNVNV